jgi:hypothetical protein
MDEEQRRREIFGTPLFTGDRRKLEWPAPPAWFEVVAAEQRARRERRWGWLRRLFTVWRA